MARITAEEGEPLVVDLTGREIWSWDELWDALEQPCGLPPYFAPHLGAWYDTLGAGGVSDVLDAHPLLVVRVEAAGLFAPGCPEGEEFVLVTENTERGRVEVVTSG